MRKFFAILAMVIVGFFCHSQATFGQGVVKVDSQPFKAQVKRVLQAMEFLGEPLPAETLVKLKELSEANGDDDVEAMQKLLDQHCLAFVNINPESRVKVAAGPVDKKLFEQGWRAFLVKVQNEAGVTAKLQVTSPHAAPVYSRSTGSPAPNLVVKPEDVPNRWTDLSTFDQQPMSDRLSGLEVEYRIVQVFSRDRGKREAVLAFDVGQGTQDLGFRNEVAILFECAPAVKVVFDIIDHDGQPTTAHFVFRDKFGRVYPARSRRLAPDFFFHDQVYRASGESILLPPGEYDVAYTRGPEYLVSHMKVTIPEAETHKLPFRLTRWIQLSKLGWYSGDHHVHAAGCAHYESPTEGVTPGDMMRHIVGEDLNVGCVLSWGPCWYYQKEFFDGRLHPLSNSNYLMRYDVEVSGFPSSHTGHLCLLNLTEDDYEYPSPMKFSWNYAGEKGDFDGTKTTKIGEWPSWDLPVLQWGKKQGGIVGFSHSGWGLEVPEGEFPSYAMPKFDGIGANEYVVDVCHNAVDFISSVDTPLPWELSIWYHTLNCGYECRISGETDFPCIYGERVGLGRVYVRTDPSKPLDYTNWVLGLKEGRSYVGDGLSHLIDFKLDDFEMGAAGKDGRFSVVTKQAGTVSKVTCKAAALLNETPDKQVKNAPYSAKPYWHIERARIGESRKVPVELVVNGKVVAVRELEANGNIQDLEFDVKFEKSSWVAVRILGSCHTNPIFVEVDNKPIRASKRSAEWCRKAVDICWNAKVPSIRKEDKEQAQEAFEFARKAYDRIIAESVED